MSMQESRIATDSTFFTYLETTVHIIRHNVPSALEMSWLCSI